VAAVVAEARAAAAQQRMLTAETTCCIMGVPAAHAVSLDMHRSSLQSQDLNKTYKMPKSECFSMVTPLPIRINHAYTT
jgi:hypothetical protein